MPAKKKYIFSKTQPTVAHVISKVRLMQNLTLKEELVYLMHIKGISKKAAQKIMEGKLENL